MRKRKVAISIGVTVIGLTSAFIYAHDAKACTSGGAMGAATEDGRPIVWQNLDWGTHKVFLRKHTGSGGEYDAIEVRCTGSVGWNGLNSQGLAYVNNSLHSLGETQGLFALYGHMQRHSDTVQDVRDYLDARPWQNLGMNFVVMDKTGQVVDFEVGPDDYWEYDPENPSRQAQSCFQSPRLFVTRANKPFQNESHQEPVDVVEDWPWGSTKARYTRAKELFTQYINDGDRLGFEEVIAISRDGHPGYDEYPICNPRASGSGYSIWSTVNLGVMAGEDPRYATMLVALGIPDYTIYVPVWVELSQAELCEKVTSWDDNNLAWWSYKIHEDRFDHSPDYDAYIRGIFDPVEDNIIAAVKAARTKWLVDGHADRFHEQVKSLHHWSAWAAYRTITSAYHTAGASGRDCNQPPRISALDATHSGLSVTFHCDAHDPDGDGIQEYWWDFGDGSEPVSGHDISTVDYTFPQAGTYLVMCYAKDGRSPPAANLRFKYVDVATVCADGQVRPCGTDVGACEFGEQTCSGGAWGDCLGGVEPGAEACNGLDDDCDGALPADEADADLDGYLVCEGDCLDDNADVHPGKSEAGALCSDGIDNDCDGATDTEDPPCDVECSLDAQCDDGDLCNGAESCAADQTCQPGEPPDCDDGNPCTDDACEPQNGCGSVPNTLPCDDGDACTMEDACQAGVCSGVPLDEDGDGHAADSCGGDDCDDTDPWIHPGVYESGVTCQDGTDNDCDGFTDDADPGCMSCGADADCRDDNPCNGEESCSAGACEPGTALDCDDGDPCTDDRCVPATGCEHAPDTSEGCADEEPEIVIGGSCGCTASGAAGPGPAILGLLVLVLFHRREAGTRERKMRSGM